ncbi:hypothetical protein BASA81_011035 [Batrachochytrium salamandrivorans]|nr:hypothetical protein BASA81_011035 [Batrachochytrium salamandrivorans]
MAPQQTVQIPPPVLSLLKRSKEKHHRSMYVLIGDECKELVPLLISVSNRLSASIRKQSILWCYKADLGFSTNRKKRLKQVKKLKSRGLYNPMDSEDTSFDTFASSNDIRWCYYKETEQILGQTFGFLILQDFEALTPNILARTIETVEGGGAIFFLLKTMDSLKRLYSLTMDVHVKFTSHHSRLLRPRFNERFILTLQDNTSCIALDEEISLIPLGAVGKHAKHLAQNGEDDEEDSTNYHDDMERYLSQLPSTSDQILHILVSVCKTVDQAKSVSVFTEAISAKTLNYTIALTASRGRGKSASLGLSIACALAYGYSNILVTAPSVENVQTVFEFVSRALVQLKFVEHTHFTCVTDEHKHMVRLNVFKTHRQTVQFVDANQKDWKAVAAQAEMLVIDEAAAIPLGVIRSMLGPYLVLMSSTIDGYEGTGRSLSIKLFDELRKEQKHRRVFKEIHLQSPIRYGRKDPIEQWLNHLLLLDATSPALKQGTPHPSNCQLFLLDRDTLFAHHKVTEEVLRRITGLMIASHYKNTPNDLQLLSDAPAHRLFVLLGPNGTTEDIPDILCVAQVAFEGNIPGDMGEMNVNVGEDDSFENNQQSFVEDEDSSKIRPRKKLNPLLVPASDVPPPVVLDYIGVSFGVTPKLYKFWEKAGYLPLYLRQTENAVTGEFSCMMIKPLGEDLFADMAIDFAHRFSRLLAGPFRGEPTALCLAVLTCGAKQSKRSLLKLTARDQTRLEAYSRNLVDFHFITDLLPVLAERYFFGGKDETLVLSALQQALLVGLGLQMKTVEVLSVELGLPVSQLLAMLNKAIRKFASVKGGQEEEEEIKNVDLDAVLETVDVSKIKAGSLVSAKADPEVKKKLQQAEEEEEQQPSSSSKKKKHPKRKSVTG